MSALLQSAPAAEKSGLYVELASTPAEVRASQQLRYRVFADEMGARLQSSAPGFDHDRYDPYCQHLLVRERDSGRIVATTRLLVDEQAARAGGFYSQSEFAMDAVLALPGRRLEIGRTCVDPGYRQGAAIAVLWSGLAAFVNLHQIDYLFGCASIELDDGGVRAHAIMDRIRQQAMTDPALRVTPRHPVPDAPAYDPNTVKAPLPPLLKAYFRLGAQAAGEPCYDPDFNVADVFVLVDVDRIDATYSRHFLERSLRA
jgi:putative hemolysin